MNIRWAESATLAQRVTAEQSLGVQRPLPLEPGTWSYEVPDVTIIPRILAHPLVADTHHIDRDRLAFSEEFPEARAHLRHRYQTVPLSLIAAHWRAVSAVLLIVACALAWPGVRSTVRTAPERVWLTLILAVSLIARVVIVMSGGQYYSPDEDRYKQSQQMVEDLQANDMPAVWGRAMASGHPLFKVLGMLPASLEARYGRDPRAPALFFALFSVLNVWLLARVAQRFGATGIEVVWVALLFACATSFLFYARHLFPYDVAMTFGLLALYAAAGDGNWRSSAGCGLWSACAFLTYFGSWTFGASVCAVLVFGGASLADMVRRGALAVVGLAIPIVAAIGVSMATGEDFFARLREFSAQVNQGSFAEGWRLPLEYLWHAEHGLLLLWIGAVAWCAVRWRVYLPVRAVRAGLIGLVCLYVALAVLSTGLHFFVVYGRLARQIVPYLSLVAGTVLVRAVARHARLWRLALPALAVLVVAQFAFNAREVLSQTFPAEFIVEGEQFAGRQGASKIETLYAAHLYPPARQDSPAGYREVFSARHPLQFVPFQYEGFNPEQRQFLRSADIRMRVLVPAAEKR